MLKFKTKQNKTIMFKKARFYRKMKKKYSMTDSEMERFVVNIEAEFKNIDKHVFKDHFFDLGNCFAFRYTPENFSYWHQIELRARNKNKG